MPSAKTLYRYRWPLSVVMLLVIVLLVTGGMQRIQRFSAQVDSLKDFPPAAGESRPKVFDARFDIWFDPEDSGLRLYRDIEDQFLAEDTVLVAFEEKDDPAGAFSREALGATARLTAEIERIPYVRQVRSLTSNPWIRWGVAGKDLETGEDEQGLLISDLFEADPESYSDADILERMIAVLGARRASDLVGEDAVRDFIGEDASFDDFLGEPRLIGGVVSADGRTSAIQVQVLRPRIGTEVLDATFGDDETAKRTGPSMFTNEAQWLALDGIELAIAREKGLVENAPGYDRLLAWVDAAEDEEERSRRRQDLRDPTRRFLRGPGEERVRKIHLFTLQEDGRYVDLSDPADPVEAPEGWEPKPLSGYDFHVAGMPLFERNFMIVGMEDMKIVGFMFLAIALVLFGLFRRMAGVAVPLVIIGASVLGMLGAIWTRGDLLNNLTAITPNMVTAISIADAVHLIAAYFALRGGYSDRAKLIVEVIRRNALPVFLTSVTTAVGFFSLTISEIVPMRMLGYTGGIGTIFAYLLSMTLVPALLSLLPLRKIRAAAAQADGGVAASGKEAVDLRPHWADGLVHAVVRFRKPIIAVSVVAVIVSLVGLARIEIDSDFRAMFPEDNPVMSDFRWIEQRLGGAGDLEIVFYGAPFEDTTEEVARRESRLEELRGRLWLAAESGDAAEVLSADEREELARLGREDGERARRRIAVSTEFLDLVDRFEARLKEEMRSDESPLRVVTNLDSALDVLRKISQVQNENRAEYYRVPRPEDVAESARRPQVAYDPIAEEATFIPAQDAASLAAQYYLQYENGAKPSENLSALITADRRGFRLRARLRQAPSIQQQEAFARIREIAEQEFPHLAGTPQAVEEGEALATLTLTGKLFLFAGMNQRFTYSFIQSMSLALVVITILIGLIFRSAALAFLSLIPNVLPLVLPLGMFGILGWSLDGPAVLVVSVALGICVDDTIHFFTKFTRARKRGLPMEDALRAAFREVGWALTITTIVLILGFGVLATSQFRPNSMMGKLALVMIGLAWVADFIVTPALLATVARARGHPETAEVAAARVLV
ncbi:MAG: MMPL family transporter [Planctomycetota bacterium]|nr:MMPL family transporter [Planctomycetota bacterium]